MRNSFNDLKNQISEQDVDQIIEIVEDNQSLRKELKMKVIEVIESWHWADQQLHL